VAKVLLVPAYDVSVTDSQALAAVQHAWCAQKSRSRIVNALNPREKLDKRERRFFEAAKALPRLCSSDAGMTSAAPHRYSTRT